MKRRFFPRVVVLVLVAMIAAVSAAEEKKPAAAPDAPKVEPRPRRRPLPTVKVAAASMTGASPEANEARGDLVGQISLFGIPDLVQFFCNSRRSGKVVFSSQRGDVQLRIHDGWICWAALPEYPSVRAFLYQQNAVTEPQLELLNDDPLADFEQLVAQDSVTTDKVRAALERVIHLSLRELVDWSDGWFIFQGIHEDLNPPAELLFSAQGILLDALREVDEESR